MSLYHHHPHSPLPIDPPRQLLKPVHAPFKQSSPEALCQSLHLALIPSPPYQSVFLPHPSANNFCAPDLSHSVGSSDSPSHSNAGSSFFLPAFNLSPDHLLLHPQFGSNQSQSDSKSDIPIHQGLDCCIPLRLFLDQANHLASENVTLYAQSPPSTCSSELSQPNDRSQPHAVSGQLLNSQDSPKRNGTLSQRGSPMPISEHRSRSSSLQMAQTYLPCGKKATGLEIDEQADENMFWDSDCLGEQKPAFLPKFELSPGEPQSSMPPKQAKTRLGTPKTGNTGGRYRRRAPANRTCEFCGAKFTRNDRLKYHVESSHLRLEPAFKCERKDCGKAFRQRSDLVRHLRQVHHKR